jgi:hypothetical protein
MRRIVTMFGICESLSHLLMRACETEAVRKFEFSLPASVTLDYMADAPGNGRKRAPPARGIRSMRLSRDRLGADVPTQDC